MTSLNIVYWFKAFLEQRGHKKEEKALSYSITSNFLDSEKRSVKFYATWFSNEKRNFLWMIIDFAIYIAK